MTNTDRDLELLVQLGVLRAFSDAGASGRPTRPSELAPRWSGAVPLVLDELLERGLLVQNYPRCGVELYQTTSAADRLLSAIEDMGARMVAEFTQCAFTQSHTSEWCGNPYCRES